MNLWSVRFLRFFASLFLVITFIWWVLMLVSIFVTPPGMHTRGSGFTDFSFSTLTTFNLLIAILFFSIPSKSQEISNLIVAVFLLIDMILIVSVPKIRGEEGWPGIASVVWALIMSLYIVMTDRVVAWGKKEEEERLTGRAETRRSLKEWLGVLGETISMVFIIIVAFLITATLILRARDASLEAPGEKYWVNDGQYQVHLLCRGPEDAKTTVLVEAGEDPVEWHLGPFIEEAYTNGSIARFCYWDRPGVAFSDSAPSPLSAGMAADALSEALASAGEEGPWVILGAGIGGIYSRIFAARHPGEVQGLLLVDALHEDLLWQVASPGRGFLLWAWGIISPLGIERLAGAIFNGRTREDRVYGRNAYQNGRNIKAQLQENLMANSLTRSEINTARRIQENVPLAVVSSGQKVRSDSTWESKQKDLTTITNKLIGWDVVRGAKHEVWRSEKGREAIVKRLKQLIKG